MTVIFGTVALLTAFTSFAPLRMMPLLLGVAADHEAVDVLQEEERQPGLVAVHDEPRRLVGAVGVDDAADLHALGGCVGCLPLVGDDADRPAADPP